jgi:G:T-mismatch repair DNA endonuclease (very short patch repair protein)
MADVHSEAVRSYNMSRIKGKDTKPEMLVRRFLHANGFRYKLKLHDKNLPGMKTSATKQKSFSISLLRPRNGILLKGDCSLRQHSSVY